MFTKIKMEKLNVIIMGQNCEKFIGMCLESVKDADNIIYCDGGSTDETLTIVRESYVKIIQDNTNLPLEFGKVIENPYDQEDPKMNGKQRNFYLDYLKKNHMGEWVLCLDADEVVEDINKIKEFINIIKPEAEDILFSPKMRHLIGDFGHEDATQSEHFVLNRLFKVRDNLTYPEAEHPILNIGEKTRTAPLQITTIWHLREVLGIMETRKKYNSNLKKSNTHTEEELRMWYMKMISGSYPTTKVELWELPEPIRKEFGL